MVLSHDTTAISTQFSHVQSTRTNLLVVLEQMQGFIVALHKVYGELVKIHDVKSYTLGLDSLHFQHKVLEMEYDNIQKILLAVENRMYCEYFKLYKMVQTYLTHDMHKDGLCHLSDKYKKIFPVYKDLEPFKVYNFAITVELQENICGIIQEMSAFYLVKEAEVQEHAEQADKGINVDNMVTTQRFNNQLFNERINVFMRYLEVFNKQHRLYLHNLLAKSTIILEHLTTDIQVQTTTDTEKAPETFPELNQLFEPTTAVNNNIQMSII